MLSQTEVTILRMMALGFGAKEAAGAMGLDFKEFSSLYSSLLVKTQSWDELGLGLWWAKNKDEYANLVPDNLVCFDFTKI